MRYTRDGRKGCWDGMRDLFFHIGLHKTGTTYLQQLILENRDLFAQAGLALAPYLHPIEGNHYPMIEALRAERFRPEAFARILGEVAATPGDKVLITAEEFCSAITSYPDRLAALYAAAARHFNPRIVIFVRRQDFLKESVFVQAVKTWHAGRIEDDTHYNLDLNARVLALDEVFGRANVKVALYRDGGANDLLGALVAALELEIDRAGLRPIPPQNVSMHRRQVLFMSQLPKEAPKPRGGRRHMQFAREIAMVLQRSRVIADDGGRFLMSPRARHDLVAAYQDGNRALVARHGIADAGRFIELPSLDEPWAAPAPITATERAAALGAVIRTYWTRRRNPLSALGMTLRASFAFARMPWSRPDRPGPSRPPGPPAPPKSPGPEGRSDPLLDR
jgi:hypothetical protein